MRLVVPLLGGQPEPGWWAADNASPTVEELRRALQQSLSLTNYPSIQAAPPAR